MLNVEVKVDHQIHDICAACAACAATKAFYNMSNYWERKKQIPFWGEIWGSPDYSISKLYLKCHMTNIIMVNFLF